MNRASIVVIVMVLVAITIHVTVVAYRTRHPKPAGHLADAITRVAAGWTTLGLVAIAGAISYNHLYTLASANGQTAWRASAFPLSVDGVEVVASLVLLNARRRNRPAGWLPWFAFVVAGVASLIANVAVAPDHLVARIIAAWPAIALVIASKMFFGLLDEPAHPSASQPHPVPTPATGASPTSDLPTGAAPGKTTPPLANTGQAAAAAEESSPLQPFVHNTNPTMSPAIVAVPWSADAPIVEPTTSYTTAPGNGHGLGESGTAAVAVRLPVDVMRRIPVQQGRYDNWLRIWQQIQQPNSDPHAIVQDSGLSLRTIQFIRSAGAAGLLNSPIPPAHRMLNLATPNHPADTQLPPRPTAHPAPSDIPAQPATTTAAQPATATDSDPEPTEQPDGQLTDATTELLAEIDRVLQSAAT